MWQARVTGEEEGGVPVMRMAEEKPQVTLRGTAMEKAGERRKVLVTVTVTAWLVEEEEAKEVAVGVEAAEARNSASRHSQRALGLRGGVG